VKRSPDPITPDALSGCIVTRTLGRTHFAFGSVTTTMEVASRLAKAGAPHGSIVTAEHQTAGRGRRGRRWISEPGLGIWCSVLLRAEECAGPAAPALGLIAACSVVQAARTNGVLCTGVKWPNDVHALEHSAGMPCGDPPAKWPNEWVRSARKIAGVLVETSKEPSGCFVVGIGVNVHHSRSDFPSELSSSASSVDLCAGRNVARPALLADVLCCFEERLGWSEAMVRSEWHRESLTIGRRVEVSGPHGSFIGQAEAIDVDGALKVNGPSGIARVTGGETTVRCVSD